MHLPLIISRFSNLLFFVQKTNQVRLTGFNLQKYLADNVDISFYGKSEDEIWKQIGKSIEKQNTEQFKKAIVPIKPIFASHWQKAFKNLLSWKQYFQGNSELFEQVILDIKKLSGTNHFLLSKIPIYLVSDFRSNDKDINAWFSWMPKQSFIVVEIPFGLKVSSGLFQLGVLAHEFFHLILKQNKNLVLRINQIVEENRGLFEKLSKGDILDKMFFEELLVSSFIPEGYLSKKYFDLKIATDIFSSKDLLDWRRSVAFKMQQTAKKYISNARQIDKEYLEQLITVIKENAK
ncbi:MAG: hypothetical protein ABII95_02080 [Patescibacteria group bacterium]|nr:hypothetical protein [Patescibacteria group bacterium]